MPTTTDIELTLSADVTPSDVTVPNTGTILFDGATVAIPAVLMVLFGLVAIYNIVRKMIAGRKSKLKLSFKSFIPSFLVLISCAAMLAALPQFSNAHIVGASSILDIEVADKLELATNPGSFIYRCDSIRVNDATEYGYKLHAYTADTNLINGDNKISSITTAGALGENTWGYIIDTNEISKDSTWNPILIDSGETTIKVYDAATAANSTTIVCYGVNTTDEQAEGIYNAAITYSAISNSACGNVPEMQTISQDFIGGFETGEEVQLCDNRDGKVYWTVKTGDSLLMNQNLDIEITESTVLHPEDSNVAKDVNFTNGAFIYNFEDKQYIIGHETYADLDECMQAGNSQKTCEHGRFGTYYNWDTFTTDTEHKDFHDYYASNEYDYVSITDSICPKGWQLPDNNSDTHSWQRLYDDLFMSYDEEQLWDIKPTDAPFYLYRFGFVRKWTDWYTEEVAYEYYGDTYFPSSNFSYYSPYSGSVRGMRFMHYSYDDEYDYESDTYNYGEETSENIYFDPYYSYSELADVSRYVNYLPVRCVSNLGDTVVVSFNDHNGTSQVANTANKNGGFAEIEITDWTPTKEGRTLIGWKIEGDPTIYHAGERVKVYAGDLRIIDVNPVWEAEAPVATLQELTMEQCLNFEPYTSSKPVLKSIYKVDSIIKAKTPYSYNIYFLKDARDGKEYPIVRYYDACLMMTNLDLDLTEGQVLTYRDTDLNSKDTWTVPETTQTTDGINWECNDDECLDVFHSYDPGDKADGNYYTWYTANTGFPIREQDSWGWWDDYPTGDSLCPAGWSLISGVPDTEILGNSGVYKDGRLQFTNAIGRYWGYYPDAWGTIISDADMYDYDNGMHFGYLDELTLGLPIRCEKYEIKKELQ